MRAGRLTRRWLLLAALVSGAAEPSNTASLNELAKEATALCSAFVAEVTERLDVPPADVAAEVELLESALWRGGARIAEPQVVILVDRSPQVQAAMILLGAPGLGWEVVGTSSVSTGVPGRFDYFETALGAFEHALANPDFRAEGTKNELGIRGYGRKGMRVYDFGWAWSGQSASRRSGCPAREPMVSRLSQIKSECGLALTNARNDGIDVSTVRSLVHG